MVTQVVMLGTGTPFPNPERSGPATAVVVDDVPYLVDFGPGVVRRVMAAYRQGVSAFGHAGINIKTAFLTHLHSDHTMGYPDLIFTPWIMGRKEALTVYGPPGIKAMTENILRAWQIDIAARAPRSARPDTCQPVAHEIRWGVVYRDAKVTVTAFPVNHHEMKDSFGFRFDTPDRRIIISGDTTPAPALINNARGCDVLVHEAYSMVSYKRVSPDWQDFRRTHHTSSEELAAIANETKPRLLVLYHCSNAGEPRDDTAELLREVRNLYSGEVIAGSDLDVL